MKYFIPALIWAIVILVLSLISANKIPHFAWSDFIALDKVAHIGMYFVFALLLNAGFYCSGRKERRVREYVLFGALFGLIVEGLQYVSHTGRHFEWADVAANTLGMYLGVWSFIKSKNNFKICGLFLKKF